MILNRLRIYWFFTYTLSTCKPKIKWKVWIIIESLASLFFVDHNGIWIWATPNIILHMSRYCRPICIAGNWSAFSTQGWDSYSSIELPWTDLQMGCTKTMFGYWLCSHIFREWVFVVTATLTHLFSKQNFVKRKAKFDIWCSRNVAEDSSLLGCDAVSTGK
jgi:hypothetical protein